MTATQQDIKTWLRQAKDAGAAYLIIGLDPMDYENFPIVCDGDAECNAALQRLIQTGNYYDEVYDLSLSLDEQLSERRSMHLPPKKS